MIVAMLLTALSTVASAQSASPAFRPGRLTIFIGAVVAGATSLGEVDGNLRRNQAGAATAVPLFRADAELGRSTGAEGRLAVALTRSLALETALSYTPTSLTVTISGDSELPAGAVVSERLGQYALEVGAIYLLPGLRLGTRVRPYATGGGGYLRQLHEGRLLVETGSTLHAGGGVQYWARQRRGPTLGVRGEGRFVRRRGGVDFEESPRWQPRLSVLGFVGF